jgi:hypothetical protein
MVSKIFCNRLSLQKLCVRVSPFFVAGKERYE